MIGIHRAVTAVALCGFQIGLTAQHPPQHTAPRGNSASVLIDGSKEPLLVPDELAFKLLLVTLSAAGENDFNAFAVRTAPIRLSGQDSATFSGVVSRFRKDFAAFQMALKAINPPAGSAAQSEALLAVRDINRSIDSLVTRTLTEATGTLSATGRALLTEHLAYIKTRTRIYASPKM